VTIRRPCELQLRDPCWPEGLRDIPASCNVRSRPACHPRAVGLRCLIVDDNAAFLAAAHAILEGPDFTIVGEATNAHEALEQADHLAPDLVLLDIDLGEDSGFALARQLADREGVDVPTMILLSAHPGDDFADLIAESPALGFIPKPDLSPKTLSELLSSR